MRLTLADGTTFSGRSFGAPGRVRGEVVFCTGLTGYVETLTDPSYRGQILVLTFPLQGNYGVPRGPYESDRIQVAGLVVHRHAAAPSHHASEKTLGAWLAESGVPAMEGVDTRALTKVLREHGTMEGRLETAEDAREIPAVDMKRVVEIVSPSDVKRYAGSGPRILVIDTGAKESIVTALVTRGANVTRVSFASDWEPLVRTSDGVMLTNGPGDPADLSGLSERIRTAVLARGVPTFGICLGHQILARAAGATTYKLPYGHRSHNQPVQDTRTKRAYVTSQNHGYAVSQEQLPADLRASFVNLNDRTNEGLSHERLPMRSVQFHPEGAAGPCDTSFLFDDFMRMIGDAGTTRAREGSQDAV